MTKQEILKRVGWISGALDDATDGNSQPGCPSKAAYMLGKLLGELQVATDDTDQADVDSVNGAFNELTKIHSDNCPWATSDYLRASGTLGLLAGRLQMETGTVTEPESRPQPML